MPNRAIIAFPTLVSALALALAGCAAGGGSSSSGSGVSSSHTPRPLTTPDQVASRIHGGDLDNLKSVWYQFGVRRSGLAGAANKNELFTTVGRPASYARGPFSAQVLPVDLDGAHRGLHGGSDALVRVTDGAAWDWQLLAFRHSPSGWTYAGSIDMPNNRLGAPVVGTKTLGPDLNWLTVTGFRQTSATLSQREAAWYTVRNGRLTEVLRIPSEGHRIGSNASFNVAYRSELLDTFLTPDNTVAVTVNLEAVYTNSRADAYPGLSQLFSRTGVVRYVQDPASGTFVIDNAGTDWSPAEVAGLLTENADEFVRLNTTQVADLTRSSDPQKKSWVTRLLQDCRTEAVRVEVASWTADATGG